MKKWDKRFLDLAKEIASYSKDPSTKVGAVIVDKNNRIISSGYNGLPRKIKDSAKRLNNRETKLLLTLHAEVNAILFSKQDLTDCIIYTYPFPPCAACSSVIIQSGIFKVIAPEKTPERWISDCNLGKKILREAGVKVKYKKNLK